MKKFWRHAIELGRQPNPDMNVDEAKIGKLIVT